MSAVPAPAFRRGKTAPLALVERGTPSRAAVGVVLPIAAASAGKSVWPSRTVVSARSAACRTASADVSPYAFVTALVSASACSVVATPAAAASELMRRISMVRLALSPKAEMVW